MRTLALLLLVAGCGDSGRMPGGDQGVPDLGAGDLAGRDLAVADQSVADLAGADLSPPVCAEAVDGGVAPGDRCASAIWLTAGTPLANQDTTPLTNDYDVNDGVSSACQAEAGSAYLGPDAAYAITIPAGKTLTVTVQHVVTQNWYPMVAIVTDCCRAGPTCLAMQDLVIPNGNARVVNHTNAGAAPLDVFILVDGAPSTSKGAFTILAQLN